MCEYTYIDCICQNDCASRGRILKHYGGKSSLLLVPHISGSVIGRSLGLLNTHSTYICVYIHLIRKTDTIVLPKTPPPYETS